MVISAHEKLEAGPRNFDLIFKIPAVHTYLI